MHTDRDVVRPEGCIDGGSDCAEVRGNLGGEFSVYSGAVATIASTPTSTSWRAISMTRTDVSSMAPPMIGTRPAAVSTIVRAISTRCVSVK